MRNQETSNYSMVGFIVFIVVSLIVLFLINAFKEDKWTLVVGTESYDLAIVQIDSYSDKSQCLITGNSYLQQQGGKYTYFECGQDCSFSNTGNSVICKITCDNTGCSD